MSPQPKGIVKPHPGQESVWDYPRPPLVEPEFDLVRIEFAGYVLVETNRSVRILETSHPPCYYIPQPDILMEFLFENGRTSLCEFKGRAIYWDLQVDDRHVTDAAWSYPDPLRGYGAIRNCLAFYAGRMDACYVGEHRVVPQPGLFYGGWITPHVVGPFKGEPGSEGW